MSKERRKTWTKKEKQKEDEDESKKEKRVLGGLCFYPPEIGHRIGCEGRNEGRKGKVR